MTFETDKFFMRLALSEARKGMGRTSPNPCVGSVVVKEGKIVGKGYHQRAGTPHAEIHALRQAGENAVGATLYVNLEPCSHTGRTPPCCEAIVKRGIDRVVMGMVDPNPLVQGKGREYLLAQGISVTAGILEDECRILNQPFIKHITTSRPWTIMKAGMSLDGKITYQGRTTGSITGPESLLAVHRLRDRVDAIMVGIGTVIADNPSLTTRLPSGKQGRDPIRIVVDSRLAISEEAVLINQKSAAPTWIFCGEDVDRQKVMRLEDKGATIVRGSSGEDGGVDLPHVLDYLGKQGVMSLLVEGGASLHGSMLRQRLYDYAQMFIAPILVGEKGFPLLMGCETPDREGAFRLTEVSYRRLGHDMMVKGLLQYPC